MEESALVHFAQFHSYSFKILILPLLCDADLFILSKVCRKFKEYFQSDVIFKPVQDIETQMIENGYYYILNQYKRVKKSHLWLYPAYSPRDKALQMESIEKMKSKLNGTQTLIAQTLESRNIPLFEELLKDGLKITREDYRYSIQKKNLENTILLLNSDCEYICTSAFNRLFVRTSLLQYAVVFNNFDFLKYARSEKWKFFDLCSMAMRHCLFDIAKWAHEEEISSIQMPDYKWAAYMQDKEMIEWMLDKGIHPHEIAYSEVIALGNLDFVKWLYGKGFPHNLNSNPVATAILHDRLTILQWLLSNGFLIDDDTLILAISHKNLEILEYLNDKISPLGPIIQSLVDSKQLVPESVLQWSFSKGIWAIKSKMTCVFQ